MMALLLLALGLVAVSWTGAQIVVQGPHWTGGSQAPDAVFPHSCYGVRMRLLCHGHPEVGAPIVFWDADGGLLGGDDRLNKFRTNGHGNLKGMICGTDGLWNKIDIYFTADTTCQNRIQRSPTQTPGTWSGTLDYGDVDAKYIKNAHFKLR